MRGKPKRRRNAIRKIYIVGSVASGKTTLAKRLSEMLQVPWYELDTIVHHQTEAGRIKRTPEEQMEVIRDLDREGSWIFEGTDRASYRELFEMADRVFFLDPPLWKRRWRILTRFLKQKLGWEKCHYEPDLEMLRMMFRWTRGFEEERDEFEARLSRYSAKVIRLQHQKELEFLRLDMA